MKLEMKKSLLILGIILMHVASFAQFKTLPSGIQYRIVKKGTGKKTAKIGDFIACKMKGTVSGKTIFSTKEQNKGVDQYMNFKIVPKQFNGDVIEALMYLHDGDSAVIMSPQDSFYRGPKPPFVKKGDMVIYTVSVLSVRTPAELKKEQELFKKQQAENAKAMAAFKKQQDAAKKAEAAAKAAIAKDDAAIKKYIKDSNLTNFVKTASGLQYAITENGTGPLPQKGDELSMNYRGRLLNGTAFDSNIDSVFGHVQPLKFPLGQGRVIQGWDEAMAKFPKGTKATLLIPSRLGYGAQGSGANIPPNSPLRFDVEVLDFKTLPTEAEIAATNDQEIQNYLKANNLQAQKTASGLYYIITQEGDGKKLNTGDNCSMNYTGKLINGNKFDSNVDSTFGHVQPYTFALGKKAVIGGWDEGVALLSKGAKATLLIPSKLGYGSQEGNPRIPANSVLIFDVEVLDAKAGN